MDFKKLIALRESELARVRAERDAHKEEQSVILDAVSAEKRESLTDAEQTRFDELSDLKRAAAARATELEGKLVQLRAELADDERLQREAQSSTPGFERRETASVTVGQERRTYSPGNAAEGISFIRDVVRSQLGNDPEAGARLARHMVEERAEKRDVGTGAFAGLTVPQYLTGLVAPGKVKGRPLADNCRKLDLPPDGMSLEISRITTGTAAAAQATENAAVQETDIDDTRLSVAVNTIAGQQDVSRQSIDRSVGSETIVVQDLINRYHTELDRQIINADGTSGTHLGILSTSSIISVTYTDSTGTPSEAWGPLWDLAQQIESGVYARMSHFVMHPRRWAFFASAIGTNQAMIGFNGVGAQLIGADSGAEYGPGVRGIIGGIPVIVDANIPTNISSTTDPILGVTAEELFLWEQPGSPLFIRAEQTGAGSLSVKLVVYGYSAFTAGRYPGAHGKITGSGLGAPTFGIAAS